LSWLKRGHSRSRESFGQARLGLYRRSWRLRRFARTAANDPARLPEAQRLLPRGGTILGTASRGKFSAKVGHGENRALPKELFDAVKAGMDALGLFALLSIGGDGSLSIAQQMFEHGIPIVGVPKTIDNDLEETLFTFGFDSAVSCATDALDRLHTTAESHNRDGPRSNGPLRRLDRTLRRRRGWRGRDFDSLRFPTPTKPFAQKSRNERTSEKSSQSSSLRKAPA